MTGELSLNPSKSLEPKTSCKESVFFRTTVELVLALLVGSLIGMLVLYSLRLSSQWQFVVALIPVGLAFVLLVNNLQRFILAAVVLSVPLNLDVSVIISPYAINPENAAAGHTMLIALTELRLSLVMIVLMIGYALWLVRPKTLEQKPVRLFPATTLPALGLLFFSILSVTQAQDYQLAMFRIAQLVEVFLAYFYLANHILSWQDMEFVLIVTFSGLAVESLIIVLQWSLGLSFSLAGFATASAGPGREGGTLGNAGPAGGYLSALSILACAMIWGFKSKWQIYLAAFSAVFGLVALIGTGSRIGWVGFAVTIILFGFAALKKGWIKPSTLSLLAVVLVLVGALFYSTVYNRLTGDDTDSATARIEMWKLSWNMIQANPWLGVGAGNYALRTPDYYTYDVGEASHVINILVHNAYLGILAESGIFALLCYLGVIFGAIRNSWISMRSSSRFISLLGCGLGLAILSLSIQMVTGAFFLRSIVLFVWLLFAMAASLSNLAPSSPQTVLNEKYNRYP